MNDMFRVDKNLLKNNKNIIADFRRLSHLYVRKNCIIPDNKIYKEGLKLMKEEFGEINFEEKMKERTDLKSSGFQFIMMR